MKMQHETHLDINTITRYDRESVTVNGERIAEGVIVMPAAVERGWAPSGAPNAEDMARLAGLKPALVLIGTGERQRFPEPSALRPLVEAGIGFEVMDTGSACRTYNLLAGEGRHVAAALVVGRTD